MLKKWGVFLCIVIIMSLTACRSRLYDQTEGNVADVKLKAADARKISDTSGFASPALVVRRGPYIDRTPINLDRTPTWLKNHIVIRGDQLPFSYYSRTIALAGGQNILTKYQIGLDPAINISMNYSGTVQGALDLIAAKTGYVYNITRNKIYWQAFVTRTFDIAFMPGSADYLMGKPSGANGATANTSGGGGAANGIVSNFVSSDSSDSEYSSLKATLSVWKDLDSTIRQMLSPEGKVNVSESTTSVTVRDRPTNVQLVSQYIANINNNLSRQVLVKVQVLEVQLENDYQLGINWQLIISAFNHSPFVINANYGTPVSITPFTTQPTLSNLPGALPIAAPQFGTQGDGTVPSYTILLNALSQQGKTSVVTEPRVVALNNQVSVVRITQQNGYVASIQNTALAGTAGTGGTQSVGTVTSQITPGTVITGLTLYILPKILGDKIFMQVNADLSTNQGFIPFGTGNNQVQLPNITTKHFNQRSMIRSGDTLILSGFRQMTNRANANQFIDIQALGGKGAQQLNNETIVLITPILLPSLGARAYKAVASTCVDDKC